MTVLEPERRSYVEAGERRPALAWRLPATTVAIASGLLGGGIGPRRWILNAQVGPDYRHANPADHAAEIAQGLGLGDAGDGVGLLTASSVLDVVTATDEGAECAATVGVTHPTWAAGPDGSWSPWEAGTINLACWVPAPLSGAALVNAAVTATEAKSQALVEAGVPGTGTASDALVICCPDGGTEPYGGPRSRWGSHLARAVHAAVASGLASFVERRR